MTNVNETRRPPGRDELPAATSPFSAEQLRRLEMDPPLEEVQESKVTREDGSEETFSYVQRGYIIREFNEIFGVGNWSQIVDSETVPVGKALALRTDLTIVIQTGAGAPPLTLGATSERLVWGGDLQQLQNERSAIEAHALKRAAALLGRRFGLGFYPSGDDAAGDAASQEAPEVDGPQAEQPAGPEHEEADRVEAAPEVPQEPVQPELPPAASKEPTPMRPRSQPLPAGAAEGAEAVAAPRGQRGAGQRPAAVTSEDAGAGGPAARLPEILGVFSEIAVRRELPKGQGGRLMTDACQRQFGKAPSQLTAEQQEQLLAAAHSELENLPAA